MRLVKENEIDRLIGVKLDMSVSSGIMGLDKVAILLIL